MRFPNDTQLHLRMAALVIGSLFLEQLAKKHLEHWTSPEIGIVTFVLGLAWVALTAFHHARTSEERLRVVEARLAKLDAQTQAAWTREIRSTRSCRARARCRWGGNQGGRLTAVRGIRDDFMLTREHELERRPQVGEIARAFAMFRIVGSVEFRPWMRKAHDAGAVEQQRDARR